MRQPADPTTPAVPTPRRWAGVLPALREVVARTDTADGDVRAWVVGAHDAAVRVAVASRAFDRRGHVLPVAEALGVAGALGCDRVALALTGRAWSLADPVAPVAPEGDLRQRVLVVHTATAGPLLDDVEARDLLLPFDPAGDGLRWGPPVADGPVEGWTAAAVRTTVRRRHDLVLDAGSVAALAQRLRVAGAAVRVWPGPEG